MDTIRDLITTIDRLPDADREQAIADLEAILELRQGPREVALGLLALDIVPAAGRRGTTQLTPC